MCISPAPQPPAPKLEIDCEQSLFCSKIPAGGAARKRVRYSSHEPRAASRYSPLEYRPRDFAVHPARILEQKRDCSQSKLETTRSLALRTPLYINYHITQFSSFRLERPEGINFIRSSRRNLSAGIVSDFRGNGHTRRCPTIFAE